MNELRLRIYEQIINNTPDGKTSLFNKICGVTIFISIFFAVIVTENSIDEKFGDQINLLDWIIFMLVPVSYAVLGITVAGVSVLILLRKQS